VRLAHGVAGEPSSAEIGQVPPGGATASLTATVLPALTALAWGSSCSVVLLAKGMCACSVHMATNRYGNLRSRSRVSRERRFIFYTFPHSAVRYGVPATSPGSGESLPAARRGAPPAHAYVCVVRDAELCANGDGDWMHTDRAVVRQSDCGAAV